MLSNVDLNSEYGNSKYATQMHPSNHQQTHSCCGSQAKQIQKMKKMKLKQKIQRINETRSNNTHVLSLQFFSHIYYYDSLLSLFFPRLLFAAIFVPDSTFDGKYIGKSGKNRMHHNHRSHQKRIYRELTYLYQPHRHPFRNFCTFCLYNQV